MNRRDFLTVILGTTAAALVLPQIEAAAAVFAPDVREAKAWASTYEAVHNEAWRVFRERMADHGLPIANEHVYVMPARLGFRLPSGEMLQHQFGVVADTHGIERSIEPAMRDLAQRAAEHGLDRFAIPTLPMAMAYAGTIGPLRMVVWYDLYDDLTLVRFDVVGGSSPSGRRLVERQRQQMVKAQIRQRLARPRVVARIPA